MRINEIDLIKLNKNVNDPYLKSLRKEHLDRHKKIAPYKNIDLYVYKSSGSIEVVGFSEKNNAAVFSIDLAKKSKNVYYVDLTQIHSSFQGFGFMPEIYRHLLLNLSLVLMAGSAQSPGGQGIWNKLSEFPDIVTFTKAGNDIIELEYDPAAGQLTSDELDSDLYDSGKFNVYAIAAKNLYK